MFTQITLQNFKSFRKLAFKASKLNVLTGLNGSGRSSLIQALLFLRSMTMKSDRAPWYVGLNGEEHAFGTYSDLQYAYSQVGDDTVRLALSSDRCGSTIRFAVRDCESTSDEVIVDGDRQDMSEGDWQKVMQDLKAIQFVSAYRLPPIEEHKYSATKSRNRLWGPMGEYAVAYLAENGLSDVVDDRVCRQDEPDHLLQPQVDAWMDVISPGARIKAELMGKFSKASLAITFAKGINNHPFLPQNVGFGISYVLPLIVMLLSAKQGECLIIENPEAHLHPRGQAELGRLLALTAERGVQVFVESHSDHVLNGIRVSVKKGEIPADDVNVAFFERKVRQGAEDAYEQESVVEFLKIDSSGEFAHFPPGFMDEWNKQLLELLQP